MVEYTNIADGDYASPFLNLATNSQGTGIFDKTVGADWFWVVAFGLAILFIIVGIPLRKANEAMG